MRTNPECDKAFEDFLQAEYPTIGPSLSALTLSMLRGAFEAGWEARP
jgi:hypothetical protein